MTNIITGLVAMVLLVLFLGNYALTLNALPLWIIIVLILGLAIADYVKSLANNQENGEQ